MRLTEILCRWPRKRPNGYIWSGKHQMVRLVKEHHLKKLNKQIEMVNISNIYNMQFINFSSTGEEQCLCLSETLHHTRGRENRQECEGGEGAPRWSVVVQAEEGEDGVDCDGAHLRRGQHQTPGSQCVLGERLMSVMIRQCCSSVVSWPVSAPVWSVSPTLVMLQVTLHQTKPGQASLLSAINWSI